MGEKLIKYEDRLKQPIDFTGLEIGKIYPCDVDAVIEIDGKYLFLVEVKLRGKSMSGGQQLMLERLTDNWNLAKEGNMAIVMVVEHNTSVDEPVDLKSCKLLKYYLNKKWVFDKGRTFKEAMDSLSIAWNINKLKR